MSVPFDLRFIVPVIPFMAGDIISNLVPYDAPAYMPVDDNRPLPPAAFLKFTTIERRKCAELKNLSIRFDNEVIHFVVGFMHDDYKKVADTDTLRRHLVRENVSSLIRSILIEYDADKVDSLVAMHLDCDVPHVHVALSRYASKGTALKKRINSLPPALLPLN